MDYKGALKKSVTTLENECLFFHESVPLPKGKVDIIGYSQNSLLWSTDFKPKYFFLKKTVISKS
jgi:hypothetical protein